MADDGVETVVTELKFIVLSPSAISNLTDVLTSVVYEL